MRLANKVALITGAASGIGRATALLFTSEGAKVSIGDVDVEGGERVTTEIRDKGGEALFVKADVSVAGEAKNLVEQTIKRFGRIDVLFNNAGIGLVATLHETEEEDWNRIMRVNVNGIYLVSKFAVPYMIEQGGGVIINMSSCIAFVGLAKRAAYAASKGAVMALTRCMAVDYAPYKIRVNALCPGTIYTPFVESYLRKSYADPQAALEQIKKRQLTGTLGTPEDIAHAALYLASDESSFMTASAFIIDGGVTGGKAA